MEKLISTAKNLMSSQNFDALAVGVVDFKSHKFNAFQIQRDERPLPYRSSDEIYFDLASVTKPLTNSLSYFLNPHSFDEKMLLCLDHRGGLPSWGLLSKTNWKEQILNYEIKESATLYSDFSALRVMLELERRGIQQKKLCSTVWDAQTVYWTDLTPGLPLLQYGYVNGEPNFGTVHDPNARVIKDYCSHAGLFSTISGVCRTLISYQDKTNFIPQVHLSLKSHTRRFAFGWDRVENPHNTLAGSGCGAYTFGHLGFTGTSVWIDPERMIGHVILSNATKHYWYDKQGLNEIRRSLGELIWSGQF